MPFYYAGATRQVTKYEQDAIKYIDDKIPDQQFDIPQDYVNLSDNDKLLCIKYIELSRIAKDLIDANFEQTKIKDDKLRNKVVAHLQTYTMHLEEIPQTIEEAALISQEKGWRAIRDEYLISLQAYLDGKFRFVHSSIDYELKKLRF